VALGALPDRVVGRLQGTRHVNAAARFKSARLGHQRCKVYNCHAEEVTDYQRCVSEEDFFEIVRLS
jgi:hypothetical protein